MQQALYRNNLAPVKSTAHSPIAPVLRDDVTAPSLPVLTLMFRRGLLKVHPAKRPKLTLTWRFLLPLPVAFTHCWERVTILRNVRQQSVLTAASLLQHWQPVRSELHCGMLARQLWNRVTRELISSMSSSVQVVEVCRLAEGAAVATAISNPAMRANRASFILILESCREIPKRIYLQCTVTALLYCTLCFAHAQSGAMIDDDACMSRYDYAKGKS